MQAPLHRHPQSSGGETLALSVDAARTPAGLLTLRYRLTGDLASVSIPTPAAPERTDELWRRTCFEAFIAAGQGAYCELNLAPSTQWAAYRFTGYRQGMVPADLPPPRIQPRRTADAFELSVELDLSALPDLPPATPWRLGLSAVIEDTQGRISYWALAHPAAKPDFHHPDSFALELPVPA